MVLRDALYISFRESRVLKRPQAVPSNLELQDGLIFINRLVDYWSARDCYSWTTLFAQFTMTPGHQPHQIGPGLTAPDFGTPGRRPVSIASAAVVLTNTTPNTDVPMQIRDHVWWSNQRVKGISSNIPTDLYYEPAVPNGNIYLWPVPTMPYGLRLESTVVLGQFATLDDTWIAPPAYLSAVTLTLAEVLVDIWGTEMPPNLARRAMKARDAVQVNNNKAERITSADFGTFVRPAGDFNYMTGTRPNK